MGYCVKWLTAVHNELILHTYVDIRRYYYVCCRSDDYRGNSGSRKTKAKRLHQKCSRKMNQPCLARMYVDVYNDKHTTVKYIPAHTGHRPGPHEVNFLPLPTSTKEAVACKLSQGIPTIRILRGKKEP